MGDLGGVQVVGDLYARSREDGDAYRVGGMTRKLKKLLNQEKIPLSLRERLPVVCDDGGICWAPRCPARTDGQKNKLYVYFYRVGGKDE
jgi:tRNA(Ile)-lysidine synthetase-like protein